MATSQNGWPALERSSDKLHLWKVPGTNRHFLLRNGSAGFLLAHFILWYHEAIHRLDAPGSVWDEWAWAWRPVRGQNSGLSNHASGTAVDLNATNYPLGTALMANWRRLKILVRIAWFRGTIRWGGQYEGRKDQMHFEIDKPMGAVERRARRLMNTPRGRKILSANPDQRKIILS